MYLHGPAVPSLNWVREKQLCLVPEWRTGSFLMTNILQAVISHPPGIPGHYSKRLRGHRARTQVRGLMVHW